MSISEGFLGKLDKRSDGENAIFFREQFRSIYQYEQSKGIRDREQRNFNMYSGVDHKQWPTDAINQMVQEKRPITTFNYIQKYIDTVLGSLEENPLDTKFISNELNANDGTNLMQGLYDYDKERGEYDDEKLKANLDGLIFKGVLEMFLDFKNSRFGNIGLRRVNPAHIWTDPHWQSDDIRDCRMVIKTTWMTARQIKESFPTRSEEIDNYIRIAESATGENYQGLEQEAKDFDRSPEFYEHKGQSLFNVIETIYMQRRKEKRLFNKTTGKFHNIEGDLNQQAALKAMRLQGQSGYLIPEEYSVCKTNTIVPGISSSMVLDSGDHPIQVGHLPYFIWSAKNMFGERQGLVDVLADAQTTLNKRESMATYWQITQANGAEFIEEDLFEDEGEKNRYKQMKNTPGETFEVASGALKDKKQAPVQRGEFPRDLVESSDRARVFMESASSVVAASQGRSEGANESGALFNQKKSQALVPLRILAKGLKRRDSAIGEAYFYAARDHYSGIPRVFKNKKNGAVVAINQRVQTSDGVKIINDISKLARHSVSVDEANTGLNNREEKLSRYLELSRTIQNPIMRSYYEEQIVRFLGLPEDETAEMIKAGKVFTQLQLNQIQVQNEQLKMSQSQMQAQGQAMQGPREIANGVGQGNLPNGIAGGETSANNQSPSDLVQ